MHQRTNDGLLQEVTVQITAEHVAKLAEAGLGVMLDPESNASRDWFTSRMLPSPSPSPTPVRQNDPRHVSLLSARGAAGGPEDLHQQCLQLFAAISVRHQLGPVPTLDLWVPLALPEDAAIPRRYGFDRWHC
jgi:hypothetical protein